MADAIGYTAATGKRPRCSNPNWFWMPEAGDPLGLPFPVYKQIGKMQRFQLPVLFPTESDALKAADEAYLKAVADGAMAAIGEGVA